MSQLSRAGRGLRVLAAGAALAACLSLIPRHPFLGVMVTSGVVITAVVVFVVLVTTREGAHNRRAARTFEAAYRPQREASAGREVSR